MMRLGGWVLPDKGLSLERIRLALRQRSISGRRHRPSRSACKSGTPGSKPGGDQVWVALPTRKKGDVRQSLPIGRDKTKAVVRWPTGPIRPFEDVSGINVRSNSGPGRTR
jgi:hypothetical protein